MPGQISAPLSEEQHTHTTLPESQKKGKNKCIFFKRKKKGQPCSRCCCSCSRHGFWDLHSRHPGARFPFARERQKRQSSFQSVQQRFFLKSSSQFQKQHESSRICRTHQKSYSKDKDQTSKVNIITFMTETTHLIKF